MGHFLFRDTGFFEVHRIPIAIDGAMPEAFPRSRDSSGAAAGPNGVKARAEAVVRKFEGKSIWQIDIGSLKAALAKDEWVRDILISRSLPNALKVEVRAQIPIAVVVSAKGELLPVTAEGRLLGVLPAEVIPDAPLLRGESLVSNEGRRTRAIRFISELPERGPLSRKNVSEISWSEEEGFILTLMQPKTDVKFGDDKLSIKVLRVTQVLNYLSTNQLKSRVIDASFAKKVLVRLRKGP